MAENNTKETTSSFCAEWKIETPSDIWNELFGFSGLKTEDVDDTHCRVFADDGSSFIFEVKKF